MSKTDMFLRIYSVPFILLGGAVSFGWHGLILGWRYAKIDMQSWGR